MSQMTQFEYNARSQMRKVGGQACEIAILCPEPDRSVFLNIRQMDSQCGAVRVHRIC